MIDIDSYRQRIGCYNVNARKRKHFVGDAVPNLQHDIDFCIKDSLRVISDGRVILCSVNFNTRDNVSFRFGLLYYTYYIMCVILLSSNILLSNHYMLNRFNFVEMLPNFLSDYNNFGLPSVATVYVRLAYFVILSYFLNKFVRGHSPLHHKAKKLTPASIFVGSHTTRLRQVLAILLISLLLLTFLMIAIVNTSLLNPGPTNLKVYYQNVQGLIPFSGLGSAHCPTIP